MELSEQQKAIVNAPLSSISVIACAGSGKTKTVVHRLAKIRKELSEERGYIALLSFSNVAVDTFRRDFSSFTDGVAARHCYFDRVEINTIDGFITTNVIRPHSFRTMECSATPFLINGREAFLENKEFKFWVTPKSGKDFAILPKEIGNITIRIDNNDVSAYFNKGGNLLPINNWRPVMKKLAKVGAYTHEFGKYWAVKTLLEFEGVLRALVNRYPHIVIDEAQDIDSLHGAFLDLMLGAGASISLVGDPNQAIYEFAGADGSYLRSFDSDTAVLKFPLSENRRSIKKIVDVSSNISGHVNSHIRASTNVGFGAFYCFYKKGNESELIDSFINKVQLLGIALDDVAVLVRSRDLKSSLKETRVSTGQGKTQLLALACIKRDVEKDIFASFKLVLSCLAGLIKDVPADFQTNVISSKKGDAYHFTKMLIWKFVRCASTGLPSANLKAKVDWHPKLKKNLAKLIEDVCDSNGFERVEKLGNKIPSTDLSDDPFYMDKLLGASDADKSVRIDTVHQAKGESLGAALYIATYDQGAKLVEGTDSEIGRIGYVAITRARDFFVLAIPDDSKVKLPADLEKLGFQRL